MELEGGECPAIATTPGKARNILLDGPRIWACKYKIKDMDIFFLKRRKKKVKRKMRAFYRRISEKSYETKNKCQGKSLCLRLWEQKYLDSI